mgnify:CR=1 FL=1
MKQLEYACGVVKYYRSYIDSMKPVTDADYDRIKALGNRCGFTDRYYFDHVKPKKQPAPEKKKGFVCKICGYVYEGDELPKDFVCPICKHGADDFELLD